jgi:hypothetical protein
MILHVDKNIFINDLLGPVSKISDNLLLNFVRKDDGGCCAKTLVTSPDNAVILLANVPCKAVNESSCVIPECKTFLRLFSGTTSDSLQLDIQNNSIVYNQNNFSFKYHLLDESYVSSRKSISEEKLSQITYDTEFNITKQTFSDIIKYNSIIPDAEKLYFFTKDEKVFAKIGDEQKSSTNEIILEASDSFSGDSLRELFPLNILNVLLFSFSSNVISVSINHSLKLFKFEIPNLKYVVSGLVK